MSVPTEGPWDHGLYLLRSGTAEDTYSANGMLRATSVKAAMDVLQGTADQALATVDNLDAAATTLPPGSPATVTVSGPLGGKVINIGIPEGAPGMGYAEGQALLQQNADTLAAAQAAHTAADAAQTAAQTSADAAATAATDAAAIAAPQAAQEAAEQIRDNLATDINTPGNPAYEALVDVAGDIGDPQTASLVTDAESATRAALDALLDAVQVDDEDISALVGNPSTDTRAALTGFSRARETHTVPADHGVTGDGATNDSAALTAAANAAAAAHRTLTLPDSYRLGTNVALSTDRLVIDGQGTGGLLIDADGGIRVDPPRTAVGSTQGVTSVGATTVTVSGATWATDEHVGKWAIITDPAINPANGSGTVHSRRIVANTGNTLTFDEVTGYPIPAGCQVELATPLTSITLRNLTLRRTTPGGADLRISYVDEVILDNVTSIDAGTKATVRGNAISISHARRVRVTDATVDNPATFGIFVYHCDDAKIDKSTVRRSGGEFAIQIKDGRGGVISRCMVEDAGSAAYNIKCSGLNEASDLMVVDSTALRPVVNGIEFSSITNEGGLSGTNFTARNSSVVHSLGTGFVTIVDAGTDPNTAASWSLDGVDVRAAAYGAYSTTTGRVSFVNCTASGCGYEAVLVGGDDVKIFGGEFRDNCQAYVSGAARSSEIRADAARLSVTGTTFVRTAAGKATRAHRDTATGSKTLLRDTVIRDTAGGYSHDYVLSATSKAVGMATLDVFAGSTTVNKVPPSAA